MVVKKPMDLLTVSKNIDKVKYSYFEEIFADLQLIWNNCKAYNQSGSEIYRMAENMERKCKKLMRELKANLKLDLAPKLVAAPIAAEVKIAEEDADQQE